MLNEKQKQFCNEYLIDFNGTQAAIRAGYSRNTARSIANENLTKPDIQAYLKELIESRNERTKITQDEVIEKIKEVAEVCMQQIPVDEDCSAYKLVDSAGANKALDMLAKHTGVYEIDNKQKNSVLNLAEAAAKIKEALK